jgi:hypothetical protein
MKKINFRCWAKQAGALLLPLLLTQCGLVGSAANVLMTPVRVANSMAGSLLSDTGPTLPERGREIQEKGDYLGPQRGQGEGTLTASAAGVSESR